MNVEGFGGQVRYNNYSEKQKTRFFDQTSRSVYQGFRQHLVEGLWNKADSWRNVSEHCLVEVARVRVFADMVGLSDVMRRNTMVAAALHDVHKKLEKEIVTHNGLSFESFHQAGEASQRILTNTGFNPSVVQIAGSVGHDSLHEMETILAQETLSEVQVAQLIMHYVDDYTVNADWAKPSEQDVNGVIINDLDRRMDKNEANPRYSVLNEEGKKHFKGETVYQAQQRIGHLVENRIAILIAANTGVQIGSYDLPVLVDNRIRYQISTH